MARVLITGMGNIFENRDEESRFGHVGFEVK
jgi:hypothetical protein